MIFRDSADSMAPFIHVGTAISGAGTTFAASIYVHPAHTSFTTLPAASIVGTTRGKRINVVLAPGEPPVNSYLGRLAGLLPEIGGIASTLENSDGGVQGRIFEGLNKIARRQMLMGYRALDARQSFRLLHDLLHTKSTGPGPLGGHRSDGAPFTRMPNVLELASLPGAGTGNISARLRSGVYVRGSMKFNIDYATITEGPWVNTGYRTLEEPFGEFFFCVCVCVCVAAPL
jgi:hypothetical protein